MKNFFLISAFFICTQAVQAQNDQDLIRYSRPSAGGTARFAAMGGAFGAVGADLSTGAYNPAGLAVYRKGDINFGAGLKYSNNTGKIYGNSTRVGDARFVFNNFGIAGAWKTNNETNRHVIAFSNTQQQNFSSSVRMEGNTNSQSIARDMLNLAEGNTLNNLNNSYEGLAYDTYLIDYDSINNRYFSFLDVNRTVKQTRDIITTGRVNELNFSYAFTYQDKFYVGASLGFPQVSFNSTTGHTEIDEKDSMRVSINPDKTYNTTYTQGLPFIYSGRLGFNSLYYEEYFKTSGGGFNLKIGGIIRVNDAFRIGGYFHTPTIYRLTDQYQTSMDVSFDANKSRPETLTYPEDGGTYSYRVITPARVSLNTAFIFGKKALLAIDYEAVDYRKGYLKSGNIADFASVNTTISQKYKPGHNLRAGFEVNMNPFKVRAGYYMNGSPFGQAFTGEFVRQSFSLGMGYTSPKNFYLDFAIIKMYSDENYFLFTDLNTMAKLQFNNTTASITAGLKF